MLDTKNTISDSNVSVSENMTSICTYTYDEAIKASTEYFNGDELAGKVFVDKYALRDNNNNLIEKTPDDMHRRMAKEFARIEESKFKKPFTEDEIYQSFKGFKRIVPQGSPMYGIGNTHQFISLSNCFVIDSPLDAYGSIMEADEHLVQISKRRGGVGVDLSNLRPNGAPTKNAARTSTGVVAFAERYSNSIREVGQAGRRGALMETLSVHHLDILEFVNVKRNMSKVTGANISVRLSDEFLKAVEKNEDYEQRWPVDSSSPKISKKVNAKEVWDNIVENAHHMAEPGLLFWDNIIKESPADCYADVGFKTISTNPCAELLLSAFDSCRLMLINTFEYVKNPFTKQAEFDMEKFNRDVVLCQRLMDDMVDLEIESVDRIISKINSDPEPLNVRNRELSMWKKIRKVCEQGRRTGTGVTAIGDTIAALGFSYCSDKGIDLVDSIYKNLKLSSYRSSVDMAKELGAFPVWDAKKEVNNSFLNRIKDEDKILYNDMQKYGRRNIALLTTAPAGSVSLLTQTSSGIEPQFMIEPYIRRKKGNPGDSGFRSDFVDQSGDHWQEFRVYPPKVKMWMEITGETDLKKSPWSGSTAAELNWKRRVELQAKATKHVDHSISSTLNLPNDVSVESVDEIYRTAWKSGVKGVTIYRDGCRTGVMIAETKKEVSNELVTTRAPKRPETLNCDIHHCTTKGKPYFVIVGKLSGKPYEIFASINQISDTEEDPLIPKSFNEGTLTKEARGHYRANLLDKYDNKMIIKKIGDKLNEEESALTRMISTALRHGADVQFIVHQLEKVEGAMHGFSKSVSRALKKYIIDGTEVSGETCGGCQTKDKNAIVRQEGCIICKLCGWSKCG